ncbi:stage III sporulation protein AG [Paenibacillaceae bacterium]|nr:stage III sporulation protein AG [Paenibacillaceae bacterium]
MESLLSGGPSGPKRVRTLRWLLIIGCLGIALMLLNSFLTFKPVTTAPEEQFSQQPEQEVMFAGNSEDTAFAPLERSLETRLKEILEKIVGVGTVDVLVTIDSTEETVVERNEKQSQQVTDETDRNGGRRHMSSTTKDGQVVLYEVSGEQTPIIVKKIQPRVRGILIVAKGAENATVRQLMMDAVRKGVSIQSSKISIVPRKQP